ncbi:hypothetical protein HYS91_04655 [Candidatus Daviesbacteria bacterium]|nr:hypothetical protein [Candidatus Daviesbacteria bacterium]
MNSKLVYIIVAVLLLGGVVFFAQKQAGAPKLKSETAQSLPATTQEESVRENSTYGHVHALISNPQDNSLLLGTHEGLFKSADGGKTFQKVGVKGEVNAMDFMNFAYDQNNKIIYAGGHDLGVVKSTDGGVTWAKTDSGIQGTDIHALAMNPLDTNRLYVFSVGNGVYGTKDGAKSWYRIDDGPANPSVVAFGYMATPSSMDRGMKTDKTTNIGYLWAGTGGGLYSSFACFCGWTKTSGVTDRATIYTLAPDPIDKSSMLAGTKDGIYKTTDEGRNFTKISDIKDIAALNFNTSNPKTIYAATADGAIYRSDDEGKNWSKVNE